MIDERLTETVRLLRDEQEIRNLGYRFADACNRGDIKAFRALWADAGRWEVDEPVGIHAEGVDAIASVLAELRPMWRFFVQLPQAPVVQLSGDRATSTWTVTEHAHGVDGNRYFNHARYDDELIRTEAGWRYLSRHYSYYHLDQTTPEPIGRPRLATT